MSLYEYDVKLIQEKYLQLLNLTGLKRHQSGKWNFRCPLCGDSKRNPKKMRGWFAPDIRVFSCFNCGKKGVSYERFMEMVAPTLLTAYKQEIGAAWLEDREKNGPQLPPEVHISDEQNKFDEMVEKLEEDKVFESILPRDTVPIWELEEDHPARVYLLDRLVTMEMIKAHGISFCTAPAKKGPDEYGQRIIFPFVWKTEKRVYGFQARTLDGDAYPKYLTQVLDGHPKIWNMFNVTHDGTETIHVTEGIIDALFLPNAIALCGSDFSEEYQKALKAWNFCFIFDNDETGREKSIKFAELGYKVFVWPPDCPAKDINKAILMGLNIDFKTCYRAYKGVEAIVRIKLGR